jgi:hypothetical protein
LQWVNLANGNPQLFAVDPYFTQVYALHLDPNGNAVGSYALTAGGQVQSISIGHDANNNPLLVAIDPFLGHVYQLNFDSSGTAVGGFSQLAAGAFQSLAVGSDSANASIFFGLALDDQVYTLAIG